MMEKENENVIVVKNLYKSFGDKEVLKGASLTLKSGENIAVIGKSGIGKSVLAKCIVRLYEADDGEINVLGVDIRNCDERTLNDVRMKVGYLFQGGALYDSMTVRENMLFPIRRTQKRYSKSETEDMIEEALINVGLLDAINKMPAELSGGMKKRIALARTLILRPKIILYDEPTTGLDPVTSSEISELMLKIREQYNTASIIITHDMKCVHFTADYIKILDNGVFEVEGTYDELRSHSNEIVRRYFM